MRIGIDCRKAADFGIGTYIRELVAALSNLETPEIVLIAPGKVFPLLPERFEKVEEASAGYSVGELFAVARTIREQRIDLFHSTHYVIPFTDVPVVVTIHDLIHLKTAVWRKHPLAPLYARTMLRRATSRAEAILVGTQAIRKEIGERYPDATSKTIVTRFGVGAAFTPGSPDPAVLARYGLAPRGYFLFVGNDKPHKNLDRLISAFGFLRRHHSGIALVISGGSRRSAEGIITAGFTSENELVALYRGAIALVLPSLEEGFGFPVAEAMACGRPAIVSDRPALIEVGGEAALRVDPLSVESIRAAMERLLTDESLREKLAARTAEQSRTFSWRACAEATLQTYRRIATKRDS